MANRRRPLKSIPKEFLPCLEHRRHALDEITGLSLLSVRRKGLSGVERTWRCIHCVTLRHDLVSSWNGAILAQTYEHTDAYKAALKIRGESPGGKITADDIRLEHLAKIRELAKTQPARRAPRKAPRKKVAAVAR